jgi:hypothetical protein
MEANITPDVEMEAAYELASREMMDMQDIAAEMAAIAEETADFE